MTDVKSEVKRNKKGEIITGSAPLNPTGRPKKIDSAIVKAIADGYTPERIVGMLDKALATAESTRSWRGIMAVTEVVLSYQIGTPTKKIQVSHSGEDTLARLMERAAEIAAAKIPEEKSIEVVASASSSDEE